MPTLTIRNVPAGVVARIKKSAAAREVSMEQEVRSLLDICYRDREALRRAVRASVARQHRPVTAAEVAAGKAFGRP